MTEQAKLTSEMHAGIEFEGTSISSEFSISLERASESTYSQSSTNKITVSCATGGVATGLWQWVTTTSSGDSKALTSLYICRTGAGLFNTMPACPFTACMDVYCTECFDWKAWASSKSQVSQVSHNIVSFMIYNTPISMKQIFTSQFNEVTNSLSKKTQKYNWTIFYHINEFYI